MKAPVFFLALCLLAPLPGMAGGPPAAPSAVIGAVAQELELGGSDTRHVEKLLKPLKLGTGEVLWRADFAKASETDWCGSGGCRVMLFGSNGKGWKAVFDRQVREFKLNGQNLTVELYGKFCGKAGNAPCLGSYRWDAGKRVWQPLDKAPPPLDEQ